MPFYTFDVSLLAEAHGTSTAELDRTSTPLQYATLEVWFESVAQLVEHRPFKALVLGSSPSALTITNMNTIAYSR